MQHAPHYQALDEYCDAASASVSLSSSSRPAVPAGPPLVLYGPSGVGKSALLSNWLLHHQAQRETAEAMVSLSSPSRSSVHKEDFVFWHVAGCSRSSALTTNLLRRLQCQLKTHFGLKKEVAKDDKRLRWDLPDFLELASRKAAPSLILILVDGLHLLRDEEGEEDLRWLPQVYPANVRLVVSTTIYETAVTEPRVGEEAGVREGNSSLLKDSGESISMPAEESASLGSRMSVSLPIAEREEGSNDGDDKESDALVLSSEVNKTFQELCRRGWDILRVDEMSLPACQELLSSCVTPTLATSLSAFSMADGMQSTTSSIQDSEASLLALFPSQCQALLASPASKNPLFLRLLLQALRWSARQNLDLWRLLAFWAEATTVVELYERILDTWEQGLSISSTSRDEAVRRVAQEQLAQARPPGTELMDEWGNASSRGSYYAHRRGNDGAARSSRARSSVGGQDVPDELPLAEIQWRKVHADADKAIEDARVAVEEAASRAMAEAVETVHAGKDGDLSAGTAYPNEAIVQFLVYRKQQQPLISSASPSLATALQPCTTLATPHVVIMDAHSMDDGARTDSPTGPAIAAVTTAEEPIESEGQGAAVSLSTAPNLCAGISADVPLYLRGGEDFEGFGNVLGNTLAALYVARHGLTMDELVHLLLDVQEQDDRRLCVLLCKHKDALLRSCRCVDMYQQGALVQHVFEGIVLDRTVDALATVKRRDLRRLLRESCALNEDGAVSYQAFFNHCRTQAAQPSSIARRQHCLKDRHRALSDGVTQQLLEVLTTLGVLVPRKDHVLVLMLESEALRQAVFRRYIQSGGNLLVNKGNSAPSRADAPGIAADDGGITYGEATWHQAIIQYFQSQPSSLLRRCEELPWHLHVCQEWKALKTFLVELDTFKMMYRGGLKGELFEYWRLLTEGPLWRPADPAPESSSGENAQALLQDDGHSPAAAISKEQGALTAAPGRKTLPLFDIVECYNQSVEQWKTNAASLSTQTLADMLRLVGRFLADFAEAVIFRSPFPRYLRKPLDLALMEMVSVDKKEDEPLASKLFLRPLPPPPSQKQKHGSDDDDASGDEDVEKGEDDPPQDAQGPVGDWEDAEEEDDGTDESDQARQRRLRRLENMQSRAALAAMDSAYYYFKRWFWIQFPWMALANVDLALRQYLEEELAESALYSTYSTKPSPAVPQLGLTAREDGGSETADAIGLTLAASTTAASPPRALANRGREQPLVWTINKQDPTRIRALAPESVQFRTMVKSSTLHLAPHAANAPRLVDALFHDDPGLIKQTTKMLGSAGSGSGGDEDGRDNDNDDDERDREDGLQTVFVSGCRGFLSTRREKRVQHSDRRVARLRAMLDQVKAERSSMQVQLTALERQALARDLHDGQTLRDMETGEFLMQALLMRLRRLTESLTEANALGWYFEKLVEQCLLKNPVDDPQRLDALDKQVDLATSQCDSLQHHRSLIIAEKEHLEAEEVAKVQRQLDHLSAKRRHVQERLDQIHRHRHHQQSVMAATSHRRTLRHAMSFLSRGLKGEGGEKQLRGRSSHTLHPPNARSSAAEADSLTQPKKLTAFQSIFAAKRSERVRMGMEKLFKMSGVNAAAPAAADGSNGAGAAVVATTATTAAVACDDYTEFSAQCVIRMFRRVQKSNKVFLDDAHGLEAKLLSLRSQLQAQETKLVNSTLDTTTTSTTAAAMASSPSLTATTISSSSPLLPATAAAIQEEESRCANYRELSAGLHEALDQLKMGVNHLARLVAPHSATLPLATIRSADGKHRDHYADVDLHQVFALFDERITSIHEVVALDTNEKADGAIKMFANSSSKANRGGSGGGGGSSGNGNSVGAYHDLVSSMIEDTTGSSAGRSRDKMGAMNAGRPNTAGAGSELLGIDMGTVMHMKGEAARSRKLTNPLSSSLSPQRPLFTYSPDGRSSRCTPTDNSRIRIQDLGKYFEKGKCEGRYRALL